MISNQNKKYFSVNKLRKKEHIKENENISKESYESPEHKISNTYNFKYKNNDNHFYNKKTNLNVISNKNEEKDKNKENIYNKVNAYNFNENENKEDKIYKNNINYLIKGLENILEDKNESNFNVSNNTVKKRPIEVNNSKNELSFISCSKSSIYDVNYYMNESNKLSEYIKEYFKINKKYPYSKIDFYKFGRKIGQGAFGKVNIGLHILTGRVVAIKSFKKQHCTEKNMERIINERDIMKELNNKNIIKILDYFEDENYIFIVMEYINGGNLYSFIKKRMKLKEKMAKFIFKQIISAINYIHKHNIVHKDIKLENILLDINHGIKICDFGIAKKVYSPDQLFYGISGTPLYMAPEIFYKSNFGYQGFPVDVWASGIALYIML
jgi:tRNA A-37 threonylcarbamoyl transferase component Bud32